MKIRSLMLFGVLLAGTWALSSCAKKGCTDPAASNYDADAKEHDGSCTYSNSRNFTLTKVTVNDETVWQIEGDINEDFHMTSDKAWGINGNVSVLEGNTLTIDSGVTIYAAEDDPKEALIIETGAMIEAEGTEDSPITFTSAESGQGKWYGIIINGLASSSNATNATYSCNPAATTFGGSDDADNSGTLRHVVIEKAGATCVPPSNNNPDSPGLTLNAVGSGTIIDNVTIRSKGEGLRVNGGNPVVSYVVTNTTGGTGIYFNGSSASAEYIQSHNAKGDGIVFDGGSARAKYVVASGAQGHSIIWDNGYTGFGQYWGVLQSDDAESDAMSGIVGRGSASDPRIANFTVICRNDDPPGEEKDNSCVLLEEETNGLMALGILLGANKYGVGVDTTATEENIDDGTLYMSWSYNTQETSGTIRWHNCDGLEPSSENQNLESLFAEEQPSGIIGIKTRGAGSFDPSTEFDGWFESNFDAGAVDATMDWTAGWTIGTLNQ